MKLYELTPYLFIAGLTLLQIINYRKIKKLKLEKKSLDSKVINLTKESIERLEKINDLWKTKLENHVQKANEVIDIANKNYQEVIQLISFYKNGVFYHEEKKLIILTEDLVRIGDYE